MRFRVEDRNALKRNAVIARKPRQSWRLVFDRVLQGKSRKY
jgi:hypothetical protein